MHSKLAIPAITTAMLLASGLLAPVAAAEASSAPDPDSEPVGTAVRFEDAVGDVSGGIGPDIVAVAVSEPDAGLVSFRVEFASDPSLTYDHETMSTDALHILLADEANVESDDYWHAIVHGANLPQAVETGANMYDTAADVILPNVVSVAVDGPTVTLTMERALLGDPDRLAFSVVATTEGEDETAEQPFDVCPDEEDYGVYAFTSEES